MIETCNDYQAVPVNYLDISACSNCITAQCEDGSQHIDLCFTNLPNATGDPYVGWHWGGMKFINCGPYHPQGGMDISVTLKCNPTTGRWEISVYISILLGYDAALPSACAYQQCSCYYMLDFTPIAMHIVAGHFHGTYSISIPHLGSPLGDDCCGSTCTLTFTFHA
jgi:hypothetical protein